MIAVLFANGFEEIEALGTVDILRRCGEKVSMVKVSDNEEGVDQSSDLRVVGGHEIVVECETKLGESYEEILNADVVVLPGGLGGVNNLGNSKMVEEILVKRNNSGKWIAAICAAPTLLGKLGCLSDKAAVCYPGMEDELTGAYKGVDKAVISENIITSQAAGTTNKFAQAIMKALGKEEKCKEVIKNMYY